MVLTELKKALQEAAAILAVMLGMTFYIQSGINNPYVPAMILEIFLILYASYAGWSLLDREHQENAMEYLLTLPVSRIRLFFIKVNPRLLAALIILAIYNYLYRHFSFPAYMEPSLMAIVFPSFFLAGLSLSITIRSFIAAFFINLLTVGGLILLQIYKNNTVESTAVSTACMLTAFSAVIFFFLFRRIDIRSAGKFNIKFITALLLFLLIISGFMWFKKSETWWGYYITDKGDILRSSCPNQHSQLLQIGLPKPDGSANITTTNFKGSLYTLLEQDKRLLVQVRERRDHYCRAQRITAIDKTDLSQKTILEFAEGWDLNHNQSGVNGFLIDGIYYNLTGNLETKQYKIIKLPLDPKGSAPTETQIQGNLQTTRYFSLAHMTTQPIQYFIWLEHNLYRVDDSGEAEKMPGKIRTMTAWKNHMVTFDDAGMTIYNLIPTPQVLLHRKGKMRMVRRHAEGEVSRYVILKAESGFTLLDLETLSFLPLSLKSSPYYYSWEGDRITILWAQGDNYLQGMMNPDTGEIKKVKMLNVDLKGLRLVNSFPNGAIIHNDKDYVMMPFDKIPKKKKKK